jgi:hypothetical protein
MPSESQFTQAPQRRGREIGRSPPTKIKRVDFPRFAKPTEFRGKRREERFHKIIAIRHDREVAVAATMHAERNVNIRGARRKK